jgi:hypothetical protein
MQAKVLPGDANPLEILGRGYHLLDEITILVLEALPLHQGLLCLGNAIGEPVPDGLQLTQVEYPRRGSDGIDSVRDLGATEALAKARGELGLEPGDLPPQLQARPALVDCCAYPGKSLFSQ